jgi:glycosyltransferase involved in cell wall biosynthesis
MILDDTLRVAILSPTALPQITGNAVTVERWRHALSQKGVMVSVIETHNGDLQGLVDRLDRLHPHIVHAHHISRAGALMLDPLITEKYGHLPLVVSPGGTDINLHVTNGTGMKIIGKTCRMARSIIVQSPQIARLLQKILPDLKERIAAVPKSFLWFGKDDFDLRKVASCREKEILFFMPAGIRPVKGNIECLSAMEKAHAACPEIRVLFAGPALDTTYAGRFEKEIRRLDSFAKWIFQIPLKAMHSAYQGADVVLNHSDSEGLSNALLEAMAAGRPVLASDVPGNRWLVDDKNGIGPCGCLFDHGDPTDFVRKALQLVRDPALRESLAGNGRLRAAAWPEPSEEAQALLKVYESAIRGTC